MTFAYSGLLAVFLTALFTRRGNVATVMAALFAGAIAIVLMQSAVWPLWAPSAWRAYRIAYPWQMFLATLLAFGVCCLGRTAPAEATCAAAAPSPARARIGPRLVGSRADGSDLTCGASRLHERHQSRRHRRRAGRDRGCGPAARRARAARSLPPLGELGARSRALAEQRR
jgi:hypothetical protein